MMRKILLIILSFPILFTNAQTWDSVGQPYNATLSGGFSFSMNAFADYNGNLIAGGYGYNQIANDIGTWNGIRWDTLGTGLQGVANGEGVSALIIFNSDLYATGYFSSIGGVSGVNNIAKWNGAAWASVGSGVAPYEKAMAVYNGNLYVGGYSGIAMWNGAVWSSVGSGVKGSVNAMTVYNGNLYVGGCFDSAGGLPAANLAEWDGSSWTSVGGGIPSGSVTKHSNVYTYCVNALCVFGGDLYVGGLFPKTGTITAYNIASWNGSTWAALGAGVFGSADGTMYGVYALYTINTDLFVGGGFDSAGAIQASCIAQWDGSAWHNLGKGLQGGNLTKSYGGGLTVYGLGEYNGNLFVAGFFDSAGGVYTGCLAQLMAPTGINDLKIMDGNVTVYPNPNEGKFTVQLSGANERAFIDVYNMLGEQVYSSTLTPSTTEIDLSGRPAGVYLYRILSEQGQFIASGRLIIQ